MQIGQTLNGTYMVGTDSECIPRYYEIEAGAPKGLVQGWGQLCVPRYFASDNKLETLEPYNNI